MDMLLNQYVDSSMHSFDNYKGLVNIKRDVSFKKDRLLDVHYDIEDTKTKKPVVVFMYGGAWFLGSKAFYCKFGEIFQRHGYVAVIPEYVLYPEGKFDDQVEDVHAAIQWTYKNIARFGGDPNNISISGHSAGGHLIALTTVKAALGIKVNGKVLSPLPPINRFVSLMGVMDFDNLDLTELVFHKGFDNTFVEFVFKMLMKNGKIAPTDLLNKYRGRPLSTLGPKKMVMLDSDSDPVVHTSNASGFEKAIKKVCPNCETEHHTISGYGHKDFIFCVLGIDENFKWTDSHDCDDIVINLFK